jgi:hypothetical protein
MGMLPPDLVELVGLVSGRQLGQMSSPTWA